MPNRRLNMFTVAAACAVGAIAVYFAIRYSLFDKAELWQLAILLLAGVFLSFVGIVYIIADLRGWSERRTSRVAASVGIWTILGIPLMAGGAYAFNSGSTFLAALCFASVFMLGLVTSLWNIGAN